MQAKQLSRRAFATGLAAPLILGAANKSDSKNPILGTGAHTYEAIHDWGQLPASIQYGNCHGVVEDSQGRIYIHHTVNAASESSDSMVVFDGKGKFIKSWGKEFKGGAHGLHINKEGNTEFLYLCDTKRGMVVKTDLEGREVWAISGPPPGFKGYEPGADGKAKKYSPTNLTVAPSGDVYVGDGYGSNWINVYNKDGKYKMSFGPTGKGKGELNSPHGITCDLRQGADKATIIVADRSNARLQRFTLAGEHIEFIDGTALPCHFYTHAKSGDMVVPDLGARITLFDKNMKLIGHLGDDSAAKTWRDTRKLTRDKFTPGKFVCPHGACFDRKGNIFVAEWVEVGRVTKLRKV
jgi:hypothetical protein